MTQYQRRARPFRTPLAGLTAVLLVLVLTALLPGAHARFSSVTANTGDAWAADRILPPTDLVATQSCSSTPIAFRSASSGSGSTSLTLSTPAGTQPGDVLLAQVANRGAAVDLTAPAGWVLVRRDSSFRPDAPTTAEVTSAVLRRVVMTNAEPSSATFTFASGAGQLVGGIAAYTGVSTSSPVDVHGAVAESSSTARSAAVTTTVGNTRLVHLLTKRQEVLPAPTGLAQRWALESGSGAGKAGATGADEAFSGPGAATVRTSASPSNFPGEWIGQTVALRPAPGSPSVGLTW